MADLLSTQTLYPKKSSAIGLLLLCSAFVALGIWIAYKEDWMGYAVSAFFALGIPVALIQLLPASSYLEIGDTGITYSSIFRKASLDWLDVDQFFVVTIRRYGLSVHKMVGFNFVPSFDRPRIGRRIAAAIVGCEGALPDTYGKRAEELAILLNLYVDVAKAHHGVAPTSPEGGIRL